MVIIIYYILSCDLFVSHCRPELPELDPILSFDEFECTLLQN